ncbi:hypothetical protein Golomagni_01059 [Golovinomyces magnicellulatus]|nr:hypothetical protein Golomagni_01059 [Golovinomyces magnicellulatus]
MMSVCAIGQVRSHRWMKSQPGWDTNLNSHCRHDDAHVFFGLYCTFNADVLNEESLSALHNIIFSSLLSQRCTKNRPFFDDLNNLTEGSGKLYLQHHHLQEHINLTPTLDDSNDRLRKLGARSSNLTDTSFIRGEPVEKIFPSALGEDLGIAITRSFQVYSVAKMPLLRKSRDDKIEFFNLSHPLLKLFTVNEKVIDKGHLKFDCNFVDNEIESPPVQGSKNDKLIKKTIVQNRNSKRTMSRLKKENLDTQAIARLRKDILESKAITLTKNNMPYNMSLLKTSDPHESYLSSEEDVSISDCSEEILFDSDDSDVDILFDSSNSESPGTTAKAISFRAAGRPNLIEISSRSSSYPSTPVVLTPTRPKRPPLLRLPALTFTLGDFNFNHKDFPPPSPLSGKMTPKNSSAPKKPHDVGLCMKSQDPKSFISKSESNNSFSLFRRESIASTRSFIRQSLLHVPN